MGICQQCTHYRRSRPASQLLASVVDSSSAPVTKALAQMQEMEERQKGNEGQVKTQKVTAGDEKWDFLPVVTAFCGFRAAEGVFLIAEVKNLGGRCTDYTTERAEKHSCSDCAHRVSSEGSHRDLRALEMMQPSAQKDAGPDLGVGKRFADGIGDRKAFEIISANISDGILASQPAYLDYCRHFSQAGEYVVCIMQNPHHTCPAWAAIGAEGPSLAVPASPPTSLQTETTHVKNDGRFQRCGGYSFYLDNIRLSVHVEGDNLSDQARRALLRFYDTRSLPLSKWVTLQEEDGRARPIHVYNDHGALIVQVGAPPQADLPQLAIWTEHAIQEGRPGPALLGRQAAPDGFPPPQPRGAPSDSAAGLQGSTGLPSIAPRGSSAFSPAPFEVIMEQWPHYAHPSKGYSFVWSASVLYGNTLQLFFPNPPGGYILFDLNQFPEGQWTALRDEYKEEIPLKIRRAGRRLYAEWLP